MIFSLKTLIFPDLAELHGVTRRMSVTTSWNRWVGPQKTRFAQSTMTFKIECPRKKNICSRNMRPSLCWLVAIDAVANASKRSRTRFFVATVRWNRKKTTAKVTMRLSRLHRRRCRIMQCLNSARDLDTSNHFSLPKSRLPNQNLKFRQSKNYQKRRWWVEALNWCRWWLNGVKIDQFLCQQRTLPNIKLIKVGNI